MISYIAPDDFFIGGLHGKNLPFYIDERELRGADGTLSSDMMQGYDVDIDFAHVVLNLFSQNHCRGSVAYWTKGGYVMVRMDVTRDGHIRIPVVVDGKKVMAMLDTGSENSMIGMKAASDLGIDPKPPGLKLMTDVSQFQIYSYPFHSLDFGGVPVTNPHIAIATDNFLNGLGADMILGIGILRQLQLHIAYDEERLYITLVSAN
jgi:predicted aspartyl protease